MKSLSLLIILMLLFFSCQKDKEYQIPFPDEGRYDCAEIVLGDSRERGFMTVDIDGVSYTGATVIAEDENDEWVFIGVVSNEVCVRTALLRIHFQKKDVPLLVSSFPPNNRNCSTGQDSTTSEIGFDSRSFTFSWTHADQYNSIYSCKTNDYTAIFETEKYHGNQSVIEGGFSAHLFRDPDCTNDPAYADDVVIENGYYQAVVFPFDGN
ncbi:MAG: hypothetical protein AB8F78_00420 [Saprospiraceae bacterium]